MRTGFWLAIALGLVGWAPQAMAETAACADLRQQVTRMERESVRPPGWFNLDAYLRLLYKADCVDHPTVQRDPEYWYDIHGNPTGVPAAGERPANGAYTTTLAIGQQCAGEDPGNPSMCALLKKVAEVCRNPRDDRQRRICLTTVGKAETGNVVTPPGSPELPPIMVGLDGGPFQLNAACMGVVQNFGNDLALDDAQAARRPEWLKTLADNCPDFLAALQRRTGADPRRNPAAFWPAFGQLLLSGFAPPGTPQPPIAYINADPGFQRMCKEAETNMNTCATRQSNMRSIGTEPVGTEGQAGAFNQCRILYGQVLSMCKSTDGAAARVAARAAPPAPPPAAKPAPPPAPAKPSGGASSLPPQPPQQPQMSAQCQQLVSNYVQASQANDGPRALAGYNALKSAGGCGVLDKVDHGPPPAAPAQAFPTRRATPNTDSYVQPCAADQAGCAQAMRQLEQGTSPEAKAALTMHAISTGLELGAAIAGGMAATMPQGGGGGGGVSVGGGGTNMNSIGNRPVSRTYGQGAPTGPPPPRYESTITGTK